MGPVSFVSIEAGTNRTEAMEAAAKLADADIRVMSMRPEGAPDGAASDQRWSVVVAANDALQARQLLSS